MGGHISYTPTQHFTGDELCVIATFDTKGKVKPLYIRYRGYKLDVLKSFVESEVPAWIHMRCKVFDGYRESTIHVIYYKQECRWYIDRYKNLSS